MNPSGFATAVGLVALWQLLVTTGVLEYQFLPSPIDIVRHLDTLFGSTNFFGNLGHTLYVTLVGWLIAAIIGILVGLAVGLSRPLWRWSILSIDLLRAVPSVAFLPVAVLIFGFSARLELFLIVYVALWPVIVNAIGGVRDVHPLLRDVGRTLQLSRIDALRKIVLPGAARDIIVGLRLALALSLVLAVVAEMAGTQRGIGYQLVFEQLALQPELVFGYVLVIGLIGWSLNACFVGAIRWLAPGLARGSGVSER